MATLTIRNLPNEVRDSRACTAGKGHSTEAEVRSVLTKSVSGESTSPRSTIRERVERLQAAFAPYRSPQGSVVDELIAERRIEGWKENLQALQGISAGRTL